MEQKTDILNLTKEELEGYFKTIKEPAFRVKQLFRWLHQRRVAGFDEMTDLSKGLRERLSEDFSIGAVAIAKKQCSKDGTVKYLFSLADGNCIETVAMFYEHGVSVCVSSQVGCRMGCSFCASTVGGLVRNLTAAEILLQVYAVDRDLGRRVDSVVMMGIGEPLDNFCNVVRFYDMITDGDGYGISNRSVSVSTCGLTDRIGELAALKKQLTLSVSLHAPDDEKRSKIMPVNREFGLSELIKSCRNYQEQTGRRISFEYTVIAGFNDGDDDAKKLAALLRGMGVHVNLIPVNASARGGFRATRKDADSFMVKLTALRINATVRRTLGTDIDAACGQLRRNNLEAK